MPIRLIAAVPLLGVSIGCSSYSAEAVRAAYSAGDYLAAKQALDEAVEDSPGDAHVYRMESSMVDLALGQPEDAIAALRFARDRCDELSGQGVLNTVAAWLADDRALDYEAPAYEQVMIRAVLAVAELMVGRIRGDDATAYALQVLQRQQQIIEEIGKADEQLDGQQVIDPTVAYKLVAFGSYLWAIINEESPLRIDVARREFDKVANLEPGYAYLEQDLERVHNGRFAEPGNGVVQIIGFVGRGPFRVESGVRPTAGALNFAKWIWAINRRTVVLPEVTEVPIPTLRAWVDNPTALLVSANGRQVGRTATVTDVEATAMQEFDGVKDYLIARAVIRRALKIIAVEATKEGVRRGQRRESSSTRNWTAFGLSVAGLIWTSIEAADLRCWSLLPSSFQVMRVELPAGEHDIEIRAEKDGRVTGAPQTVRVRVQPGRNTYVLCMAPTERGGPPPLASMLAAPVAGDVATDSSEKRP